MVERLSIFPSHRCVRTRALATGIFVASVLSGSCRHENETVPVHGQVTYHGRQLEFGTVILKSASGRLARGDIQPDGTFHISRYGKGDGTEPGRYQVRIICFEAQCPGANMPTDQEIPDLGASLIPPKYDDYITSELEIDVGPELTEPVVFELTDD
jgi:hypothetical protein